jgi:hypothetical protein
MQSCMTKFFRPVDSGKEVFEYLFQKEEADRKAEEAKRRQQIKEVRFDARAVRGCGREADRRMRYVFISRNALGKELIAALLLKLLLKPKKKNEILHVPANSPWSSVNTKECRSFLACIWAPACLP